MSVYYAQTPIPCPCGSTLAYWHGPETGRRVYCCDACWHVMPGSGTRWPDEVASDALLAHLAEGEA
jgi:hypothetical protein